MENLSLTRPHNPGSRTRVLLDFKNKTAGKRQINDLKIRDIFFSLSSSQKQRFRKSNRNFLQNIRCMNYRISDNVNFTNT